MLRLPSDLPPMHSVPSTDESRKVTLVERHYLKRRATSGNHRPGTDRRHFYESQTILQCGYRGRRLNVAATGRRAPEPCGQELQFRARAVSDSFVHALWQNHFRADPAIIGRSISLDDHSYSVIGVMPAESEFPILAEPIQLWVPITYDGQMPHERNNNIYNVIARLKPEATQAQAAAQMNTIADRLARQYSADQQPSNRVRLVMHMSDLVGDAREALLLLFAAVAMVLLIACMNVANLILVGATHRSREVAIRTALGASRIRLVRQLLTENLILALLGGSLGLALGYWAIQTLIVIGPRDIPRLTTISLNSTVLLFTLGISVMCTLLFGLLPALRLSKAGLGESLKTHVRGATSTSSAGRLRNVLVACEIALSLVMVLAAGLLLQTLWHLKRVNPGFDPTHVLTFDLSLPDYSGSKRIRLFEQLVSRIRAVPGVAAASMTFPLPFSGDDIGTSFEIEGQHPSPEAIPYGALCTADRDYFRTMHIPFLKGDGFPVGNGVRAKPVAIVNEAFAKRYFPGENPIGKRLRQGAETGPDRYFVPARLRVYLRWEGKLSLAGGLVYADLTWAEGTATQGCDRSADPAAGMTGAATPPQCGAILARKR